MKLKYLFAAIAASLFVFAACEKEGPTSLDNIQLEKTYLSIPVSGGSASVKINATEAWSLAKDIEIGKDDDKKPIYSELPKWLTSNVVGGGAGETTLTFTAEAIDGGREQEFHIVCGEKTQYLLVRQGSLAAVKATCADVIAGADGKTFTATGVCTSIANTNYGNWYLADETGEIYIYGTVDGTGKYNWSSFNIEVGDVVTVTGPKTTYNGTVELVDVTVDKVVKSLIKVDKSEFNFGADGGEFTVKSAYKGNGVFVKPSADWIVLTGMDRVKGVATKIEPNPADTAIVSFRVLENNHEESRSGSVEFSSSSSSSTSTMTVSIGQTGLQGTESNPFTVAQAIAALKEGTVAGNVYVKGIISNTTKYNFGPTYNTASFWISDDGVYNDNLDLDFEAYSVYWLGGSLEAPTAAANIKGNFAIGDEVVVYGALTTYTKDGKTTYETASKKAKIHSLNGVLSDENGVGNLEYPFNIAGIRSFIDRAEAAKADAKANGLAEPVFPNVCVTGKISAILYTFSANYGTGTFWISDDGTAYGVSSDKKKTTEPTKDFECYSVYWKDNTPWKDGDPQPAVGDKVVVKGQYTIYSGTYETASKKAWVQSHVPAN